MSDDLAQKHLSFHDTGKAMVAMEVNWPDGASTGWHSHPSGQLLYAIQGVMLVSSAAGSWVVPPSRALWLTAGLEHEVTMSGEVRIRTVFINEDEIAHLPGKTCIVSVSDLLRELIVAAVQIPVDYAEQTRDGLLMRLLVEELKVSNELPLHLPLPRDGRIRAICESLMNGPDNTLTIDQWAEQLGVVNKTVHRLFVSETGMTFTQWREQARLLYALRRLAHSEKIIDIALGCGYGSPSAFTAMFRRHFGLPPSSFYHAGGE